MNRLLIRFLVVVTLLGAGAGVAAAQSLAGTVRDTSGAVLPGVTIEASSPALITKVRTGVTDETGQYRILDLPPGTYRVSFTLPGFAIDERWEEEGTLFGVMMRAGKLQIGLNQDDWKKGRDRQKGIGVRLAISTTASRVDELARQVTTAGFALKSEPHDTEWQSRAFEVIDPSGFLLTIYSETSA